MDNDCCILCGRLVTANRQAVSCDVCSKWQHRTCNTGITQYQYKRAVAHGSDLQWVCAPCSQIHQRAPPSPIREAPLSPILPVLPLSPEAIQPAVIHHEDQYTDDSGTVTIFIILHVCLFNITILIL